MAHTCPECGQACSCGGDIDDLFLEGTKEEAECTHCPDEDDDDDELEFDDDDAPASDDDDDELEAA